MLVSDKNGFSLSNGKKYTATNLKGEEKKETIQWKNRLNSVEIGAFFGRFIIQSNERKTKLIQSVYVVMCINVLYVCISMCVLLL